MRRATKAVVVVGIVLVIAAGALHQVVGGIARDNLSNADFVRTHAATPATHGLQFRNVTIPSDGLALAGWWIPAAPGNLTAILVHGLGSNMSKVMQWAPHLHGLGVNVLAFDLRNHGASPDTASGRVTYGVDEARDVLAAVAYVRANAQALAADGQRIVLYGASMGAATVLLAAAEQPEGVLGVVADSSFASLRFQARTDGREQGYPGFLVSLVLQRMDALAPAPPTRSDPERAATQLEVPVLLAHCTDDARIQFASFERLHRAIPDASTWTGVCASGPHPDEHVDGYVFTSYNATVQAFLGGL